MTTTPNVPLRLDMRFEVPGTPEQVWAAIATADGISGWFLPTELDEREGGTIALHMGDAVVSPGTVTAWDPPHRFAYVETDWADFSGHPGANVSPIASEFLVEAVSGGTCVVRMVCSAFGVGDPWEQEFFDMMEEGWPPIFDNLRVYLTHFPGQRATSLSVHVTVPGEIDQVWGAMRRDLGVAAVGDTVALHGLSGHVYRLGGRELLVRLDGPCPGYVEFAAAGGKGVPETWTQVEGFLFSDDARAYVERERPTWRAWLEGLGSLDGVTATSTAGS
jgi:uncharacterized protein YndB with AHSA1/START domain